MEDHGTECWELEAITPDHLQRIVTQAIDSVIDIEAFNMEIAAEHDDATRLQATRNQLQELLLAKI